MQCIKIVFMFAVLISNEEIKKHTRNALLLRRSACRDKPLRCGVFVFYMSNKTKNNTSEAKFARRQLFKYVKEKLNYQGSMKAGEAVRIYAAHYNISLPNGSWKIWLYEKSPFVKQYKQAVPVEKKQSVSPSIGFSFYMSKPWRSLRAKVIKQYGCACMKCGYRNTKNHVDHIYPRSKYPHLELEFCNLQVLCEKCNSDKSNTAVYDMRPSSAKKWQDELKQKAGI